MLTLRLLRRTSMTQGLEVLVLADDDQAAIQMFSPP
jgi:hypothetical protein